jgi:hypothetical protein
MNSSLLPLFFATSRSFLYFSTSGFLPPETADHVAGLLGPVELLEVEVVDGVEHVVVAVARLRDDSAEVPVGPGRHVELHLGLPRHHDEGEGARPRDLDGLALVGRLQLSGDPEGLEGDPVLHLLLVREVVEDLDEVAFQNGDPTDQRLVELELRSLVGRARQGPDEQQRQECDPSPHSDPLLRMSLNRDEPVARVVPRAPGSVLRTPDHCVRFRR